MTDTIEVHYFTMKNRLEHLAQHHSRQCLKRDVKVPGIFGKPIPGTEQSYILVTDQLWAYGLNMYIEPASKPNKKGFVPAKRLHRGDVLLIVDGGFKHVSRDKFLENYYPL